MKRFRAILVLLLSLALPYSAVAGMLDNVRCHHDGLGALVDASAHRDHAAMAGHHHDQAPDQAGDHGCDCAVKCTCQHHCAAGGSAALALALPQLDLPARTEAAPTAHSGFVAAVYHGSPLRPPTTAPAGAA